MTETRGLIISKETPQLRLFRPRPTPEPGIALVLFREGQPLITLWPGDRLTSGEVSWGNYKTLYKVDITEHSFSFNCMLPCQGEAFEFRAQVDVTYSVENPSLIVERNITDARIVLEPLIVDTMREVSRKYDVEQSAEAEKSIKEQVLEESRKYNTGLKILRFMVKLSLEEATRNHIRKIKDIERTKESELKQAELEKQRIELEVERTKMRLEFYLPLIKEGQWQLLALQLANHPDDVVAVAQMIRQHRQADMENQLKALKIMLEEDVIEGFQMEEAGKRVLQRFIDSFGPDLEVKALGEGEKPKALEARQDSQDSQNES